MKKHYILCLLVISSLMSARPGIKVADKLSSISSWDNTEETRQSNPPLMNAIMNQDLPEITRLLKKGDDPNERNSATCTPLSRATAFNRDPSITQLLLEHGADPNAFSMTKSNDHWRELDATIARGTEKHVQLLLQYGANPFQLKKFHKKTTLIFPENNKRFLLVQAERMKRVTTLLLCLKKESWDNLPHLPAEIRVMIKGAVQEICTK